MRVDNLSFHPGHSADRIFGCVATLVGHDASDRGRDEYHESSASQDVRRGEKGRDQKSECEQRAEYRRVVDQQMEVGA